MGGVFIALGPMGVEWNLPLCLSEGKLNEKAGEASVLILNQANLLMQRSGRFSSDAV